MQNNNSSSITTVMSKNKKGATTKTDAEQMRELVKRRREKDEEYETAVKKLKRDHQRQDTAMVKKLDAIQGRVTVSCLEEARQGRKDYFDNTENVGR
jgi:hypothetical protein